MARVWYEDPIFFTKGANPTNQFTGLEVLEWRSVLPGASEMEALKVDPAIADAFRFGFNDLQALGDELASLNAGAEGAENLIRNFIANGESGIAALFNQMAAHDITTALRGVIGQVATTVGFTKTVMSQSVRNVYGEPLAGVMMGLQMANAIFESKLFQTALDGITWIPIVGWIIRIVLDILTLVAKIADHVRKKRDANLTRQMAKRFHLPLISSDPDMQKATNETLTKNLMQMVQDYRIEMAFWPPYLVPGGSHEHFKASAARDPEGPSYTSEYGNDVELTDAWYVFGKQGSGGMGFIPGSSDLVRTLEFPTRYCGAPPSNTGDYAVTAKGMAGYLWQNTVENGPSMFCVDTKHAKSLWDDYVHGLLEYAEACVYKGFTCSESGYECSGKEWCGGWNYGGTNCNKARHKGKKQDIPGNPPVSHFAEMVYWIAAMFWGRGSDNAHFPYDIRDRSKDWDPDTFYYQNTKYAMTLDNLRERQMSVLGDYTAMLVTPASSFEAPNGAAESRTRGMFPALAQDRDMQRKWEETVTRIINDPQLLRAVDYRDIPAYRWPENGNGGQSPREIVKQKKQEQSESLSFAPLPMPGGPDENPPPKPPDVTGQGLEGVILTARPIDQGPKRPPMPRASRVMFGAAAGAAAVAGGALLYNKVGRRFFT